MTPSLVWEGSIFWRRVSTLKMSGSVSTSGFDSTRRVMLTICKSAAHAHRDVRSGAPDHNT